MKSIDEYLLICRVCGGSITTDRKDYKKQVVHCETCSAVIDSLKDYVKKQKSIIDYLQKELTEATKRKLIRIDCKICGNQITKITSERKGNVEIFYVKCEACASDLDVLHSTVNWMSDENQELKATKEHLVDMIEEIRTELEA